MTSFPAPTPEFLKLYEARAEALLEASPPLLEQQRRHLQKSCQLDDLLIHARADRDYGLMQRLMEVNGLLAKKAEFYEGFAPVSRDLERVVIPEAIDRADWPGFLRASLRAIHCRRVAGQLANPGIVAALLERGRRRLALDVATQLADPLDRAWVRHLLAISGQSEPVSQFELKPIVDEIDAAAPPRDEIAADRWAAILIPLANRWGPELADCWSAWTSSLESWPPRNQDIWLGVLKCGLNRPEPDRGLLSLAVAKLGAGLGRRLSEVSSALSSQGRYVLLELLHAAGDGQLCWQARLIFRSCTREDLEAPILWSVSVVEAGAELWATFDRRDIDRLESRLEREIADLDLRRECLVALRVVLLEFRATSIRPEEVLEIIQTLDRVSSRLDWGLRCLGSLPPELAQRILGRIADYLLAGFYEASPDTLRRFLDRAGSFQPEDLQTWLEVILKRIKAPGFLLDLARSAREPRLLDLLLDGVERWVSLVVSDEVAVFDLRRQVIDLLVVELCTQRGNLEAFRKVIGRILPEEEIQLLERLLMELGKGTLALSTRAELKDLGLAILTGRSALLLDVAVSDPRQEAATPDPLEASRLFHSVASNQGIEDELRALGALLETPVRPSEIWRNHLESCSDADRRAAGTVDLVQQAVDFQHEAYPPNKLDWPSAMEPLEWALGEIPDARTYIGLLPELLSFVLRRNEGTSAELRESFLRVMRAESPWPLRLDALAALMSRLALTLDGEPIEGQFERCRKLAELLEWAIRLPNDSAVDGLDELRAGWHEVVPWLVAIAENLPAWGRLALRYPNGVRWARGLGVSRAGVGHRQERFCAWLEAKLNPSFLPGPSPTPWTAPTEILLQAWAWLDPQQKQVVELCLEPAASRPARIESWLGLERLEPGVLAGIAPLLVHQPRLLKRLLLLLPDTLRAETLRRLAYTGFLPLGSWDSVATAATDSGLEAEVMLWGEVWHPGSTNEEQWLGLLARRIGMGSLDVSDPRGLPLRRRLRGADHTLALQTLSRAFLPALTAGGPGAAENALRWWLEVYVGIRRGSGNPEGRARLLGLWRVLEESKSLGRQS